MLVTYYPDSLYGNVHMEELRAELCISGIRWKEGMGAVATFCQSWFLV
jgi:hypothetical protein